MRPRAPAAAADVHVLDAQLPGWDYADAYEVAVDGDGPHSAITAIRCVVGPGTGRRMLQARDLLVSAVGLKPAVTGAGELFPVLVDTPHLAVVGLDDAHLDFRIVVSLDQRRVRCVTAVRRHNALGRAYFAVVRPFHRRLVPHLLARAARRRWTPVVIDRVGRSGCGPATAGAALGEVPEVAAQPGPPPAAARREAEPA